MNFPMALTCTLYGVSRQDIAAILKWVRLSREGPAPPYMWLLALVGGQCVGRL